LKRIDHREDLGVFEIGPKGRRERVDDLGLERHHPGNREWRHRERKPVSPFLRDLEDEAAGWNGSARRGRLLLRRGVERGGESQGRKQDSREPAEDVAVRESHHSKIR
jgi:hypothetical protein